MSKVNELVEQLHGLLASGAFPPGARFPSEYELQERFDVSRFTANKAVALLVAEGMLERGVRGSGTYVRKTKNFPKGWIAAIDDLKHPYNTAMIAGAAQEAFAQGYMLSIFNPELNDIGNMIKQLRSADCVGVLTAPYQFDIFMEEFTQPGIYLDSLAEPETGKRNHSVMCDNYGAASEMMSKVLASGKKEVVIFASANSYNRRQRIQGFTDAMVKYGIQDVEQRKFLIRHGTRHDVKITLRKILRKFPDVDFIVTDCDDLVYNIMLIWNEERPDWKTRTGISGFGNVHGISDLHHIPTVDQHPWHIGSEAVKALLEIIESGNTQDPVQIEVPAEVINAEYI